MYRRSQQVYSQHLECGRDCCLWFSCVAVRAFLACCSDLPSPLLKRSFDQIYVEGADVIDFLHNIEGVVINFFTSLRQTLVTSSGPDCQLRLRLIQ